MKRYESIDDVPAGYIPGTKGGRSVTHLYYRGKSMCRRGQDMVDVYKNKMSKGGICKDCMKRALAGLKEYTLDY